MEFTDAMESTVTRKEAVYEIEKHCSDVNEFFEDCGDSEEYEGATVLIWLGY